MMTYILCFTADLFIITIQTRHLIHAFSIDTLWFLGWECGAKGEGHWTLSVLNLPRAIRLGHPVCTYVCTYIYARMYVHIYRWLIESKGRGRYKVCRLPRHETHALPLERRRRRTSCSCSNVHLVSIDTPTLSAQTSARRQSRFGTNDSISGVKKYPTPSPSFGQGSALLHLLDRLRGG